MSPRTRSPSSTHPAQPVTIRRAAADSTLRSTQAGQGQALQDGGPIRRRRRARYRSGTGRSSRPRPRTPPTAWCPCRASCAPAGRPRGACRRHRSRRSVALDVGQKRMWGKETARVPAADFGETQVDFSAVLDCLQDVVHDTKVVIENYRNPSGSTTSPGRSRRSRSVVTPLPAGCPSKAWSAACSSALCRLSTPRGVPPARTSAPGNRAPAAVSPPWADSPGTGVHPRDPCRRSRVTSARDGSDRGVMDVNAP